MKIFGLKIESPLYIALTDFTPPLKFLFYITYQIKLTWRGIWF